MPDPITPVAAEGLRERIDDVIADWATNPRGRHLGDLVVAALAGDSDPDLPALMAEAILRARFGDEEPPASQRQEAGRVAAAASGVRDEHLVYMTARAVYAEGQLSARRDHETRWELEKARADALRLERDEWRSRVKDMDEGRIAAEQRGQQSRSRCRAVANAYNHKVYPDLIGPTREAFEAVGLPYVIENVEAAAPELKDPALLCGPMFGLKVYRHRLFETNWPLAVPPHPAHVERCTRNGYLPTAEKPFMSIHGGKHSKAWQRAACDAMGMPWIKVPEDARGRAGEARHPRGVRSHTAQVRGVHRPPSWPRSNA
jgi:hypothetical protein